MAASKAAGSAVPDVEAQSAQESEPLLGRRRSVFVAGGVQRNALHDHHYEDEADPTPRTLKDQHDGIHDSMTYNTKTLTTWRVFFSNERTVWLKPELWHMMLKLSGVALLTCICTLLFVPNPAVFKTAKFTAVSKFLNVVVGLLLGFFLSSSMVRWHNTVNGFLGLLDSLRNLHVQFLALGVRDADLINVIRYGYGSAWLLYEQLIMDTRFITTGNCDRDGMWDRIGRKKARLDRTGTTAVLTAGEINVLRLAHDPPHILWTWVGVLLGGLAQDGWIPPMNSPTYGRIMNICQNAHAHIREVKLCINVQAPLSYCHTLSTLVHINNLLSALTMGIVSGLAIGTALLANDIHFHDSLPLAQKHAHASMRESDQDWQNLAVTGIYCFFGPLLYQALLMISMFLAQPFQSEDAEIPMKTLLYQLEVDLCDSRDSVRLMGFKMPFFKEKPKADKEADDGGE